MLNTNKVRLMTKLALYENKEGKEDIRLSKYYKTDYIRYQVIKSLVCATIGYILILGLAFIYKFEHLIRHAISLDYKTIGLYVLGFYIIIVVVYGFGSFLCYSIQYDKSRKKLGRYFKLLKRLNKVYKDESPES